MSGRVRRQQIISDVLARQPVGSQEELRALLKERGVAVTQATLSRDLREIGALKTMRGYQLPPNGHAPAAGTVAQTHASIARTLAEFVTSVEPAGNLVVLRTGPGQAQVVALEIDRAGIRGVVGCLGGDDTVFVAASTTPRARELVRELQQLAALRKGDGGAP